MDKVTLGQYGWIIVVALVLTALFVLATPLGTSVADSVITLIRGTAIFSNEAYSDESIKEQSDYMNDLFDYSESLQPGLYMHKDAATLALTWEEYVENSYISIFNVIISFIRIIFNCINFNNTRSANCINSLNSPTSIIFTLF